MANRKTKNKVFQKNLIITDEMLNTDFSNESLGLSDDYVVTKLQINEIRNTVMVIAVKEMTLTEDRIKELIKDIKPIKLKKSPRPSKSDKRERVMAMFNLADFHFGRMVWGPEGFGFNYSSKTAKKIFTACVDDAVKKMQLAPYAIDKIFINLCGDFMNADTIDNTTVHGTNQDCDTRWKKNYLQAGDLLRYAIQQFSQVAPVEFAYIAGNHDEQKGFYLVQEMNAYFRGNKDIKIDNNPSPRQVVTYGSNVIVLTHGEEGKKRLPQLPFIEPKAKELVSTATNIEVISGHLHKHQLIVSDEGVTHEILGASTIPDDWTYKSGFCNSTPEAYITYYNKTNRVCQNIINMFDFYKKVVK